MQSVALRRRSSACPARRTGLAGRNRSDLFLELFAGGLPALRNAREPVLGR